MVQTLQPRVEGHQRALCRLAGRDRREALCHLYRQAQNINKVKPLVDGEGWEYEVLLDPNSEFKRAMGVNLIPHVFIVDGNGKIAESRSGYTDGAEGHIIEVVRKLIAEK